MFNHCELLILILALTLDDQVHTGEIIGGKAAVAHSRPYMVLLKVHRANNKTKHCGGFLLTEDFVMTAAHCQGSSYTVLLGVHNVHHKLDTQHIPVEQSFPHKDYYENDIMLLKLSTKANLSKNVRPIALASQDDGSLPKSCSVSGWGITAVEKENMSYLLMEANVTLTDNELCAKEDKVYCSEGETGPGSGDSGGPLVCEDGKAYGVVSKNYKPPCSPKICRYTKIPDYRIWIESIMEQHGKL